MQKFIAVVTFVLLYILAQLAGHEVTLDFGGDVGVVTVWETNLVLTLSAFVSLVVIWTIDNKKS